MKKTIDDKIKQDNLSKYLLNISGYTQEMVDEIMETGVLTPVDDVEHTKEYYDTERNKAPDIQNMSPDIINMSSDSLSDGLSNRSMKQKHGRAVQTVSEQMQEELEPISDLIYVKDVETGRTKQMSAKEYWDSLPNVEKSNVDMTERRWDFSPDEYSNDPKIILFKESSKDVD